MVDVEGWYRAHGPMVLRRCRSMLGDEMLARDAMHDVFVQVARRSDVLNDSAPVSLLWRIATQICLNHRRTRRRRPESPDDTLLDHIASLDETDERGIARAALDRIFGREPESTRVMAVLHLVDGLTLEEVAEEVGLSVSGVRKRLRTLRTHLHELEGL